MNSKTKRRVIVGVQIAIALLVVIGFSWLVYKALGYNQAQKVYKDMQVAYAEELGAADPDALGSSCPVDFASLQSEYPEVVAWLKMDDVDVSYPIVQGDDNERYLHCDPAGAESIDGAIFLDYRNKSIADDKHVLVYGHNMMDESMFGLLDNYTEEDFYRSGTGAFTIYTPQAAYRYEIFAAAIVDPANEAYTTGFKNAEVFGAFVKGLANQAMYETGIDVTGADYVVTLSTCSASDRLVLSAKRVSVQPWTN